MSNGSTKTKTIVGIDYSLNSPAVCISTNGGTAFSDCYFYYLTSKKKHIGKMLENVIGGIKQDVKKDQFKSFKL